MLPSCVLSLEPSQAPPQLVGERIIWAATAADCGENPVYQFRVGATGSPFRVVRDFSPANTFVWTPMQEGRYDVRVIVKDGYQGKEATSATVSDAVNSRVSGRRAVITPTLNPLVALYSAPPCSDGTIHVQFGRAGHHPDWRSTNTLPCEPGQSRNFLVAGMLPNTTYKMRHVITDHHHHRRSSPLRFTTGNLPADLTFPSFTVRQPPGPGSDLAQDMIFHALVPSLNDVATPVATDLTGRVNWFFDPRQSGLGLTRVFPTTLVPGGTVFGLGRDQHFVAGFGNVLREFDLAGNPVQETNMAAVNARLTALGHDIIYGFTHDVQHLPNGATVVLGITERTVTIKGTPTHYIGNMIVVLDQDFQVAWAWDAFDHLDVKRGPVLGEVCRGGEPDPTCLVPLLPAVGWLHANALSWSPADGNLVLSVRHQDWVIKIDYRNGQGDGHVVWRLGRDGDFAVDSPDPYPWFSHQHNPHYVDDTTLVLFDNGNTRCVGVPGCPSRGQAWVLDEEKMTATPVLNVDLGNYSNALGAAQRLSNGNFSFTSGNQGPPPNQFGQSIEVRPDGTRAYVLEVSRQAYRSYRVRALYEGTKVPPDDGDGASPPATHSRAGSGLSPVALEGFMGDGLSDELWAVIAAAWNASRGRPAPPTTPPATTPRLALAALARDGERMDRFFTAGTGAERRPAFSRPTHERAFADCADRLFDDGLVSACGNGRQ